MQRGVIALFPPCGGSIFAVQSLTNPPTTITIMRHISEIILHCTATPRGRQVTVADIDRWHRARGWAGIGYHYVVCLDGSIHPGRPIERIGAHCSGHNSNSIGIVYAGGVETDGTTPADTRTPAQRKAIHTLVKSLLTRFPKATVHGHNEFSAKACPCFDVRLEFS